MDSVPVGCRLRRAASPREPQSREPAHKTPHETVVPCRGNRQRPQNGSPAEAGTLYGTDCKTTSGSRCIQGPFMSIGWLADLAQWLQVAQAIVAIIGLPILTQTMLMIWRQAKYAHHAAISQVYQNTANDFASVQRYFMDHPEYRSYFYDGKSIDASDPEYMRVLAIAEFWLHALHNLTIHRRYMGEYPWCVWERDPYATFLIRAQYCSTSCMSIPTGIRTRYTGYSQAERLRCVLVTTS
jgi:hypothetical protein